MIRKLGTIQKWYGRDSFVYRLWILVGNSMWKVTSCWIVSLEIYTTSKLHNVQLFLEFFHCLNNSCSYPTTENCFLIFVWILPTYTLAIYTWYKTTCSYYDYHLLNTKETNCPIIYKTISLRCNFIILSCACLWKIKV